MSNVSKIRVANAGILLAIFLAALTTGGAVAAEGNTTRSMCHNSGAHPVEPFGDYPEHSLQVIDSSCTMEGGPLGGTVLTQQVIWEYGKNAITQLSGQGVYRKPGAIAAYVNSAGTLSLQYTDGRFTGWTALGKGRIAAAAGGAASLNGKTYSWTARPIGNRNYVIETTFD